MRGSFDALFVREFREIGEFRRPVFSELEKGEEAGSESDEAPADSSPNDQPAEVGTDHLLDDFFDQLRS